MPLISRRGGNVHREKETTSQLGGVVTGAGMTWERKEEIGRETSTPQDKQLKKRGKSICLEKLKKGKRQTHGGPGAKRMQSRRKVDRLGEKPEGTRTRTTVNGEERERNLY